MMRAVVSTPTSTPKHLWYWDSTVEVGAPGHFEFFCENRQSQPVKVNISSTNCQCAGADIAVVPTAAYRDYAIASAIAGSPFCPASGPLAAIAHASLDKQLTWNMLVKGPERAEQIVPAAASSGSPQVAIVRLAWTGKGDVGPKTISAQLFAGIGDDLPTATSLSVDTVVVPAFDVVRQEGSEWVPARELPFGELRENAVVKQTFYLLSSTRPYFLFKVEAERPDPCISVADAVPASEEEIASVQKQARGGSEQSTRQFKSVYKVEVAVRERVETVVDGKKVLHQLDLGPIDQRLHITGVDAGNTALTIKGRVLGDVTILRGADAGRIELGNSFAADQDRTKDVVLIADRPGLDLALVENEITPNYLKVKLEPIEQTPDGRKQWRLRVTVPKGTLYGSLPDTSGIVLKTSGASQRRLRFPVRGMTFDAGGPRF
jgi:hypothetical protein